MLVHQRVSTSKIDFINQSMVLWFTGRNVGLWNNEITGIAGNLGLVPLGTFAPLRRTKRDGEVNFPKRSRAHAHSLEHQMQKISQIFRYPKAGLRFLDHEIADLPKYVPPSGCV